MHLGMTHPWNQRKPYLMVVQTGDMTSPNNALLYVREIPENYHTFSLFDPCQNSCQTGCPPQKIVRPEPGTNDVAGSLNERWRGESLTFFLTESWPYQWVYWSASQTCRYQPPRLECCLLIAIVLLGQTAKHYCWKAYWRHPTETSPRKKCKFIKEWRNSGIYHNFWGESNELHHLRIVQCTCLWEPKWRKRLAFSWDAGTVLRNP